MLLTYRYKLLPTKAQHRALERILEDQRQLYNAALEERIACYQKTGKSISYIDQCRSLTLCRASIPDMSALHVNVQRATLKRIDTAFAGFFSRLKSGATPGFPRFKSKHHYKSFGFREWKGSSLRGDHLLFKGFPGKLRVHMHRDFDGRPVSCQFKRSHKGWFVTIQVSTDNNPPKRVVARSVGVDMGLRTLAALSDGVLIQNPRVARKYERKMRVQQRALSRCRLDSKRRRKVKAKVAGLHAKIANTRSTYLHQQSAMLVKNYDLIAVEALNVKGLAQGNLARSVHDASWGTFIAMLRYKAERAGAHLIEVDPKYTSQTCPKCGAVKAKTLSERVHDCPCGCVLDRDVAAARVILHKAVAGLEWPNVTHTWGERATRNVGASHLATIH